MTPIERAGYLAHAMLPAYQRRLTRARELIAQHSDLCVSASWGKDSNVMLHLISDTLRKPINAVHGRYPDDDRAPDMDAVRDAVIAACQHEIRCIDVPVPGEREMFRMVGHAWTDAATSEERDAERWWNESFKSGMDGGMTAAGCDGSFIGMRADESRARRMNIAKRGQSYCVASRGGQRVVLPLAGWSGTDVWAYTIANGLPWLRMYEFGESRERARSDFTLAVGGGALQRHGVFQAYRNAYPEWWRSLIAEFPEIAK